jgi:hypothetical protein
VLPNLLIIGAAKCGTTSLHQYLDAHPEIAMSREKELNFFVEGKNWDRGTDWYESQFRPAKVRGEASPAYSAFPFYRGVPERMSRVVPDARILYLVRDPIERIVSHYRHRALTRPEMGSLGEALEDPELCAWFVGVSRYSFQLERYLEHFPTEHVRVVDAAELENRRDETLSGIFSFLDVDPAFKAPSFDQLYNKGVGETRRNRRGQLVANVVSRAVGPSGASRLAARTPAWLKAGMRTSAPRPVLPDDWRARLEDELRPDVDRLRRHTGLAFSGWSL